MSVFCIHCLGLDHPGVPLLQATQTILTYMTYLSSSHFFRLVFSSDSQYLSWIDPQF